MSRVVDERLDDCDLELVFIAATRAEAKAAEDYLTNAGIDYLLDFEPFLRAGLLGPMSLTGVGFSVITGQASFCRELLRRQGLYSGVIDEIPAD